MRVKDLTQEETSLLTQFLDIFLDPDCFYSINDSTFLLNNAKIGYLKVGYAKIGFTGE